MSHYWLWLLFKDGTHVFYSFKLYLFAILLVLKILSSYIRVEKESILKAAERELLKTTRDPGNPNVCSLRRTRIQLPLETKTVKYQER